MTKTIFIYNYFSPHSVVLDQEGLLKAGFDIAMATNISWVHQLMAIGLKPGVLIKEKSAEKEIPPYDDMIER